MVFSYFHQSEDDTPDYGIPWLFNGPAPVARNNYYGFQDANFLRTNDDIFTAKVEHDVEHGITLRNVVRYAHEARNAQITEAARFPPRRPRTLAHSAQRDQINRNRSTWIAWRPCWTIRSTRRSASIPAS